MCYSCAQRAARAATRTQQQQWKVTYPDGTTAIKNSEVAARIASSKVAGASYAKA